MKIRLLIVSLFASSIAFADDIKQLAPTVVTATRVETNSFDLPVSIDVIEKENIHDGKPGMLLSESLIRIPGLTANNRTQMAQDPQISSRGFGARSAFGVRGVKIYVDGIPLTMPDGIGVPGAVDLDNIKSIEVMRGPFSSMYGSSAGGVINMLSDDSFKDTKVFGGMLFGSYDTRKENLGATGNTNGVDYLIDLSNYHTGGYRDHSTTDKNQATLKLATKINNDATRVTLLANWFDQKSDDPLGLPRSTDNYARGAFVDPKAVPVAALSTNSRVIRNHAQIGINIEHNINDSNKVNLMTYVGHRFNSQFLPTNPNQSATFTSATSGDNGNGKDSLYQRAFWGNDIRWTNQGNLFNKPYSFSAGLNYGYMSDARLEKNSLNGNVMSPSATLNFIKRDEINVGYNFDQYFQGKISPIDKLDIHAGLRRSTVGMRIDDHLVDTILYNANSSDANYYKWQNGSGSISFQKTTPVIGMIWKENPYLNIYANYGKGFETPTFIELAYSDKDVGGNPNLSLKPSKSDNYEFGVKAFVSSNTKINATYYRVNAYDEIVATSTGTYSVYKNAGKTHREGIEVSLESNLDHNIKLYGAYTYLDAFFASKFTEIGTSVVQENNRISGTYRQQAYGEASWKYPELGFSSALEIKYNSDVAVNNTNSDIAPAYTIYNLRAGFNQNVDKWSFKEFVRIENLTDRDYIGSVRVNDSKGYYFEPGAGRNYLLGLNASYQF